MMDFYNTVLIVCELIMAIGAILTLIGAVVHIIGVEEWKEEHTDDVMAPFVVATGVTIVITTLGLPLLMAFLYKCKKLFWDKK